MKCFIKCTCLLKCTFWIIFLLLRVIAELPGVEIIKKFPILHFVQCHTICTQNPDTIITQNYQKSFKSDTFLEPLYQPESNWNFNRKESCWSVSFWFRTSGSSKKITITQLLLHVPSELGTLPVRPKHQFKRSYPKIQSG